MYLFLIGFGMLIGIGLGIYAERGSSTSKKFWRSTKTKDLYVERGRARLQSHIPLKDMAPLVIYRSEKDGSLWARPDEEFFDGRFEQVFPISNETVENSLSDDF